MKEKIERFLMLLSYNGNFDFFSFFYINKCTINDHKYNRGVIKY